jgi:hypothetical protein
MPTLQIDPNANILVGAEAGARERQRLDLDNLDTSNEDIIVEINTTAILSDFIRALFGPSVRRLGFAQFERKYHFDAPPSVRESILENARFSDEQGGGIV